MEATEIKRFINEKFEYFHIPQSLTRQKIYNCSKGTLQKINILQALISYGIPYHTFFIQLDGCINWNFFNSDILKNKNMTIPLQALVILIAVMPLALIFKDNSFVKYAVYLLPPLNYLTERLYTLDDGVFELDNNFGGFVVYAIVYSIILITIYNVIIQKKNKQ